MPFLIDPAQLTAQQVAEIEKLSLRAICQALLDFREEAREIFALSPDHQTEVAEDVTREALDRMPGHTLRSRIFGTTDYKRACYVMLPEYHVRQALLVDSKAEKTASSARIQRSQTSLPIRQLRDGQPINEQGSLSTVMPLSKDKVPYLVSTIFVHYHYEVAVSGGRTLFKITVAALPSGILAATYVSSPTDTIFGGSPNSPALGEKFRTRLKFRLLTAKTNWRVQRIRLANRRGRPIQGDPLVWAD